MTGSFVLHGAAVVVESGAVVVLGESGIGKSTLAAAFGAVRRPVLADDCVVVDLLHGKPIVQPSYASLRASSDTARFVLGRDMGGLPFTHYSEKRRYTDGLAFSHDPYPLVGIVSLSWAPPGRGDAVEIRVLRGHESRAAVVRGAKSMPLGEKKIETFEALIDLADIVPVVHVTAPFGFDRLSDVRESLVEWAAML
jgi:hypothetical protein